REAAALPGHRVRVDADEARAIESLVETFVRGGLDPPAAPDALAAAGLTQARGQAILALLQRDGVLRRLRDGRLFAPSALDGLIARLRAHRQIGETIDIAGFKDLAGVSRKSAIPLLEYLDDAKVTRRRGNERVILE